MTRILLSIFLGAFLFFGCISNTTSIPTILPLEQCELLDDISVIVDSLDLIRLEESDQSILTYPDKLIVLPDNSLLIKDRGGKVLHFSSDGRFVRKIGTKGRGPMEYLSVQDMCVSKDGEYVHILDLGSIISYQISTGDFLGKILIPRHNYDELCPNESGGFYVMGASPDYDNFDFEEEFNTLTMLSEGGEVIKTKLPRKDYILNVSMITHSYKGSYYIRPLEGEGILYEISERLDPKAFISFGEKSLPMHYAVDNGRLNIERYSRSNYYKTILYFHDTERNEYFACIGPNGNCVNFVMDSELQNGVSWEDKMYDETPAVVEASDGSFYYIIVYDVKSYMSQPDDQMNPMTRLIISKIKERGFAVNDNPLVVRMSLTVGARTRDHVKFPPEARYYSIGKQDSAEDPKTFYLDGRMQMAGGDGVEALNECILKIMFGDYLDFPVAGDDKLSVAVRARYSAFDLQFRSMSSTMSECHLNVKELGCFAGRAGDLQTYIKKSGTSGSETTFDVHLIDLQTMGIIELPDIIGKDGSAIYGLQGDNVGVCKSGLVMYDNQDGDLIVERIIPWQDLKQFIQQEYRYLLDTGLYGDDNVNGEEISPQLAIYRTNITSNQDSYF